MSEAASRTGALTPYYEDECVSLFHGDARSLLRFLPAVDAVITDPVWPGATVPLAGSNDPELLFACIAAMAEAKRWAVQIGCDTDPAFLAPLGLRWPFFRVCWLELVRPHYKGRLMYGSDVAYLYGEPPASSDGHRVIPGRFISTDSRGRETAHPCPRKLSHVEWLMGKWTTPGEIILDPFAGSGTTLLAAKNGGRKAIGIEIEERYCEMAAKRLAQGVFNLTEQEPAHV